MTQSPRNDYDAVPYEGHPDPLIHPERLASVAWLYGIDAPIPEKSRVLEIGCATGAHIIPMAYQLPEAAFVGFDYSETQIAMACASAQEIGLKNIHLEVRDIRDNHQHLGKFDYILAHGIFSWVRPEVQDSLLEICRDHLTPNGVALIDYNVYPGWHLREFFRDLMSYHRQGQSNLIETTQDALKSLDYIADHLFVPAGLFAQSVGHLQRWAKTQSSNYLAHEFGSSEGHPVSFQEFAERISSKGLQVLGDAEIVHVIPAQQAGSLIAQLNAVAGSDYVRREQYMDYLRGRDFRRTLLVSGHHTVSRQIRSEAMQRLRFSTVARHEASTQGAIFRTPDGAMLRTVNGPLSLAIGALCKAGPLGMSFDSLYDVGVHSSNSSTFSAEAFAASLLEVVAGGLVQVHTRTPAVVSEVSERPMANAMARASARMGRDVATSMLHRDWRIDPFERRLLALLDGTHDLRTLKTLLIQGTKPGDIPAGVHSRSLPNDIDNLTESRLAASLEWFARVGVLIG